MIVQLQVVWMVARGSLQRICTRDERGSVVEKVILTAVFAALAITVGAIIVAKVTAKAHSINLNN
jgi:hypothetical protein